MNKISLAFALLTFLSACSTEPTTQPQGQYGLPPKINIDVQTITFADRSGAQPMDSPYNTSHFQPTIADAIRQWAGDRLQATGAEGQLAVIVKDATLAQQAIAHEDDWLTRPQASKYAAHAEVEVEVRGREGYGVATAQASRFETLPEHANDIEKQKAYFNVLNGLMRDLGTNIEAAIQAHLRDFIVTAPVFENGLGNNTMLPMRASTTAPPPGVPPMYNDPMAPSSYPAQ
jgi:hypothetical protein